MNNRRKISVLMPVRNGIHFLNSIKLQIDNNVRPDDQIVIIDDGSTDGSSQCLREWANQDSRLLLLNSNGEGLVAALNMGLRECSNEWVARFDVDDLYDPDRLTKQINSVAENDVAIFSDYNFINEKGQHLGQIPTAITPDAMAVSLISSQRTPHPSVLFNKYAVLEAGAYRENDYLVEDLSLWLRMNKLGNLRSLPESLLHYRLHKNSVSIKHRKAMLLATRQILNEIQIPFAQVDSVRQNIDDIFRNYENFNYCSARQLLLLRDLMKLNYSVIDLVLGSLRNNKNLTNQFKILAAGTTLFQESKLRKRYRNS